MNTASGTALVHRKTEFDDWRSLTIGIYMALTGYALMVGLPVISSSWVNNLGFTEVQVGYVTSADLFGLAIGAVVSFFVVARYDRRLLTVIAASVAIAANLLCVFFQSYEITLLLRLAAGTGAGLYTGIAVATIGGHSRDPRSRSASSCSRLRSRRAAELNFLPYPLDRGNVRRIRRCTFVDRPAVHRLAAAAARRKHAARRGRRRGAGRRAPCRATSTCRRYVPWLVLAAVVFTYISIGAYWTYIELATVGVSGVAGMGRRSMLVYTSVFSAHRLPVRCASQQPVRTVRAPSW